MCFLVAHQKNARDNRAAELAKRNRRIFAVADAVDRGESQTESEGAERGALPVEVVARRPGVRQIFDAEGERAETERNVDRKQIRPRPDRENAGCNRRSGGGRNRDHHRVDADPAAEHRPRIDMPDQRHVDAHDAGGTEPLQDARDRQ